MSEKHYLSYYDRNTGTVIRDPVYAHGFLSWSYNTRLGRLVTDLVLRQKVVSRVYGWVQNQPWTRKTIRPFVRKLDVDMSESIRQIEDFTSFNDFFTREINLSKRPVEEDPHVCISPTDGRALAYPTVEPDMTFRIKGSSFNLREFLRDDDLVNTFARGSMLINRLYLSDYHHFHFPDSGTPGNAMMIEGKYYAVGPYALNPLVPFYAENHRMVTLFDSDHFGQIGIIEIGAFTVGSIQQRYRPGIYVQKGARKGFFALGGSTVVLLFERGTIHLDADLVSHSRNESETCVRMGESIGRATNRLSKLKK